VTLLHLNVNLLGGLGAHAGAWRSPGANLESFAGIDEYEQAAHPEQGGGS
jgi:hypothetical protein